MKHTIFEFIGGAWDGMNLSTLSPDPAEAGLAAHTLKVTRDGCNGQAVTMPRHYAVGTGRCKYVVRNHVVVGQELLIRLECDEEDSDDASDQQFKIIVLRFAGGCFDGRTIRSDAADVHEAILATSCYCLTDQGAVSAILKVLPCLGGRIQGGLCRVKGFVEYRVARRDETEAAVTVILEYLETQGWTIFPRRGSPLSEPDSDCWGLAAS